VWPQWLSHGTPNARISESSYPNFGDSAQIKEQPMNAKKDTADQKTPTPSHPSTKDTERNIPKPESSSEYEGAASRQPTGNPPVEVKTETSSSSGQ
jgi:hypothetical protein